MEPADEREHTRRLGCPSVSRAPQWSPPTSGGSTAVRLGDEDAEYSAAMEPADERREHSAGPTAGGHRRSRRNGARRRAAGAPRAWNLDPGAVVAAMEPADERREHNAITRLE